MGEFSVCRIWPPRYLTASDANSAGSGPTESLGLRGHGLSGGSTGSNGFRAEPDSYVLVRFLLVRRGAFFDAPKNQPQTFSLSPLKNNISARV